MVFQLRPDTVLDADVPSPSLDAVKDAIAARDGQDGSEEGRLADDDDAVYRPLTEGIMRMSQGASPPEILRHRRTTFLSHWGDHATSAMRTIYLVVRTGAFPASTR